jgi:hypothetical protein
MIVVELCNVRVANVDYLIKLEGNTNGSIFLLAVKDNPPVSPIKFQIQVDFVKVILVQISALVKLECISLPNFTCDSNYPDGILHLCVSIASPISIVLLASSSPTSLNINKISQRDEINRPKSWRIVGSIYCIMEFDIQFVLIVPWISLLLGENN